ncbi:MAG: hypothetical protein MMC23_001916 [Stictis urceolatum]|nr:hypothetical protein [Stictis urceolata]
MSLPTKDVFHSESALSWTFDSQTDYNTIRGFHQSLPNYAVTPLVSCPELARQLGVGNIFVKDESSRLGLPAFKILGASWGCYKAISQRLGIEIDNISPSAIASAIKEHLKDLTLFAATDGNHGRAVAYMARLLGIRANIYVPQYLDDAPQTFIRNEGAEVYKCPGTYDYAIQEAKRQSDAAGEAGLLIQDTAFEGYEEIPTWIVHGYSTMFAEADEQIREATGGGQADIVVVPIGVGSLGMSVVAHHRNAARKATVVAVEPQAADCLFKALACGTPEPIEAGETIMEGMNCGTVSSIAWPLLKEGVALSVRISDREAHEAVQKLESLGIQAGPCGGATLAAISLLATRDDLNVCLDSSSKVLLLCTEGYRKYNIDV